MRQDAVYNNTGILNMAKNSYCQVLRAELLRICNKMWNSISDGHWTLVKLEEAKYFQEECRVLMGSTWLSPWKVKKVSVH